MSEDAVARLGNEALWNARMADVASFARANRAASS